mgnify:CR=1 FL=1
MDINFVINTPQEPQRIISLNARKSLNGDVMIFDHKDIDIVLLIETKKVVAFAKDSFADHVYQSQDRLFNFLRRKGVIIPESVQGGNVYGSMEALLNTPSENNVSRFDVALLSIKNFLDEEAPYFDVYEDYEEKEIENLTDPSEEASTELGEVPHEERKGSLVPGYVRGPYGMTTFYRY